MNSVDLQGSVVDFSRARQPGKAIWTIFFIAISPFRLSFLLLYFIPKRLRQHPDWTYRQALGSAVLKAWFSFASTVEFRTSKSLEPGPEKERFVTMNPKEAESYIGITRDKSVRPAVIGGMWYPKLYEPIVDREKTIVLHFHGGAYVLGGVRPMEGGWGFEVLAKATSGLVFCPQYRLSLEANCRFPAALQDGITSYQYLLDRGIPSSRIVISGDSAGANLAIALLRYLGEQSDLPTPFAALLWSPWLDMDADPSSLERHRNGESDYLTPVLLKWAVRAYRPSFLEANHPYLSPLNSPFATKVPIFMQYGTAEVLIDDQKDFFLQMKNVPGNRIDCLELDNAPHNTFLGGLLLGFGRQAREAATIAKDFIEKQKETS